MVKPLDLQVNINTVTELSRRQAEQLAKNALLNQQMDEVAIDEAKLKKKSVSKSEESTETSNLNEYPEEKNKNQKFKHKKSSESNKDNKSFEDLSDLEHRIDYLA